MIDAVTLEVIRESLISIVQEMRANLTRTAYSSIIYEGEDFSCVLMDKDSQIVAMSRGQDHPVHIFPITWSMRMVKERFGDDVHPGDIFLHNDPYTGGTHLNDIAMVYPVFLERELFLFPVVRAHWGDVGGMTPGSISGQVTEIYQEGVRIPIIRIYEKGQPNQAVLDVMFSNMRVPQERMGDFRAMVGTCHTAEARLQELAQKFTLSVIKESVQVLMDRAEMRMRRAISSLPPGEYVHESYLEGGRHQFTPLRVKVKLTISNDQVVADLSGTHAQVEGPTNVGPGLTPTGVFVTLKSFLDPEGDINQGSLRPITVEAPEATMVNARLPAPCGGMGEITHVVVATSVAAFAPALNGRVTGDLKGGANHLYIGGVDPRTEAFFVFYEYPAAGTGGFHGHDGNNVVRNFQESDITSIQPVESVEQKYPLRIERLSLREDSGGDGAWRGGLGCHREIKVLADDAKLSVLGDRGVIPPYGVCEGFGGATNQFTVRRDGVELEPSPVPAKVSGFSLRSGDVVVVRTSGGGGYGDPLERDPNLVVDDVRRGLISPQKAREVYGVAVSDGRMDSSLTADLRNTIRSNRVMLAPCVWDGDEYDAAGRRLCFLSPSALAAANLQEEDLVELVNSKGAPLRGWVRPVGRDSRLCCYLGPTGMAILRLGPSQDVELRLLIRSSA